MASEGVCGSIRASQYDLRSLHQDHLCQLPEIPRDLSFRSLKRIVALRAQLRSPVQRRYATRHICRVAPLTCGIGELGYLPHAVVFMEEYYWHEC